MSFLSLPTLLWGLHLASCCTTMRVQDTAINIAVVIMERCSFVKLLGVMYVSVGGE
jgi:hypothetical protein